MKFLHSSDILEILININININSYLCCRSDTMYVNKWDFKTPNSQPHDAMSV